MAEVEKKPIKITETILRDAHQSSLILDIRYELVSRPHGEGFDGGFIHDVPLQNVKSEI